MTLGGPDSGAWLFDHPRPGPPIDVLFDAANFTTDVGAASWVLAAGNITSFWYAMLNPRLMFLNVHIEGATIVAPRPNRLFITIPNGRVIQRVSHVLCLVVDDGNYQDGDVEMLAGGTQIDIHKLNGIDFNLSAGGSDLGAQLTIWV